MSIKLKGILVKHKINIIFFLLAILISLLFFDRYFRVELGGDAKGYWIHAKKITENPSYLINSPDFGQLEPMHNIIIGFIRMLPGNDRIILGIIQVLLFVFILLLLYNFSLEFGSKIFAFLVVFWTLTSYRYYSYVWNPNRDIWIFYFVTLLFYYAFKYYKDNHLKNLIFFSFISGIVLLTDMRYFAHIGLLCLLFMIVPSIRRFEKIKRIVLILIIIFIVLFPWIYRQYKVFGEWMIISKFRCEVFTKFLNKDEYKNTAHYYGEQYSLKRGRANLQKRIKEGTLDKEVYERLMEKDRYYSKHKLIGMLVKAYEFWRPCNFSYFMMPLSYKKSIRDPWSFQHNLDGILHIGILFPFFVIGVIYSFKRKNWFLIMLFVMLAGHTLMHALTYVQERYRLIILPYYFIISFFGLFNLLYYLRNKIGAKPKNE